MKLPSSINASNKLFFSRVNLPSIKPIKEQENQIPHFCDDPKEENHGKSVEIIKEVLQQLAITLARNKNNEQEIYEARLKRFNFVIPNQKKNYEWLGQICSQIFSYGFSSYAKGELSEKQTKVFCCQAIINEIIKIVSSSNFEEDDLKKINGQVLPRILDYALKKYPQSTEEGVNQAMKNLIVERDDLEDPINDLLLEKSGVKFVLKEEGENYNEEIMKFLNYIIGLNNSTEYFDMGMKEKQEEKLTLSKKFESDIQNLFDMVYEKQFIDEMSKADMRALNKKTIEENKSVTEEEIIGSKKVINEKEDEKKAEEKEKYREKVEKYTKIKIGEKISSNTPLFGKAQIENGNLSLKGTALFRVVTKWVEELESYFQSETIMKKEHPFKMMKGEGYMIRDHCDILKSIFEELKFSTAGPVEYLKKIAANNNSQIVSIAKEPLPEALKIYPSQEATVGKFASAIYLNSEVYMIGYLNCLIHNILRAVDIFKKFAMMKQDKQYEKYYLFESYKRDNAHQIPKPTIISFILQQFTRYVPKKEQENYYHLVPSLLSFKLGDLFRCKISSKEKEIKSLYKKIEKISQHHSKFLRVVRVKNRLEKGTKDILINLLYRETILVEMQLAINSEKEKKIEFSDSFNHYIYELRRAKFGPITQMCTIWAAKDPRADLFISFLKQNNYRVPKKGKNKCRHDSHKTLLDLPFRCNSCGYFYQKTYGKSFSCGSCGENICFHCQNDLSQIEDLFRKYDREASIIDISEPLQKMQTLKKLDVAIDTDFLPEQFLMMELSSNKKKVRKVSKVQKDGTLYLFEREKQKLVLVEKIKNVGNLNKILVDNVFANCSQLKKNPDKIYLEEAFDHYFHPRYLLECLKKEKRSITLSGVGVTDEVFENPLLRGKVFNKLKKLNLSENSIYNTEKIFQMLPEELEVLNLSYNGFTAIPKYIGRLKRLTFLDLTSCPWIKDIDPAIGELKDLQLLKISGFKKIGVFPQCFGHLISLNTLEIGELLIKNLNQNLGNLKHLKSLKIYSCTQLQEFPNSLCELRQLESLDIISCNSLKKLPDQFGQLQSLSDLQIHSCESLNELPESFNKLSRLQNFSVFNCNQLKKVCKDFGNLLGLKKLKIQRCEVLEELGENMGALEKIENIEIIRCQQIERLPQSFGLMKNLTIITLSMLNSLPSLCQNFGQLTNLQKLIINYCQQLQTLPSSFSNLSSLETLQIEGCHNLREFPQNFGSLPKLKNFKLSSCHKIESFPESFDKLSLLEKLEISECNKLSNIGLNYSGLKNVKEVQLYRCQALSQLPENFGSLSKLEKLTIISCRRLKQLGESFGSLSNLEFLQITSCGMLDKLPQTFSNLHSLMQLHLFDCAFEEIGDNFDQLSNLKRLSLGSHFNLTKISESMGRMKKLVTLHISQCSSLKQLCFNIGSLKNLQQFTLEYMRIITLPQSFGKLKKLQKRLKIIQCKEIEGLGENYGQLQNLKEIQIKETGYKTLKFPVSFGQLNALQTMTLNKVDRVELGQGFGNVKSLKHLNFMNVWYLQNLTESFGNLSSLQTFKVEQNFHLVELPSSFGKLSKLKTLEFVKLSGLESLPFTFGNLHSLETLMIHDCKNVRNLGGNFENLKSLKKISLQKLSRLVKLPSSFGEMPCLQQLDMVQCVQLEQICENFGNLRSLKSLKLIDCWVLKKLPDSFGKLSSLQTCQIKSCGQLKKIGQNYNQLQSLKTLCLLNCDIEKLPHTFGLMPSLQILEIIRCDSLTQLPASFLKLVNLKKLVIKLCLVSQIPENWEESQVGERFKLKKCDYWKGKKTKKPFYEVN